MKLAHRSGPSLLPLLPPERLNRLLEIPDGIIYNWRGPNNRYIIEKTGTVLALYFSHPQENPAAAIMSELDLLDPLNLLFGYSRAFILALIWQPQPQRIFMLGFAGGRIPAVLHHYLPDAQIDVAEIDPDVVDVAREYFGVTLDNQFQVLFGDGRALLQQSASRYNIIFVDAFIGAGQTPPHLATLEFYTLCRSHLSEDGVVAVNLCNHGPTYRAQIDTFRAVFDQVYLIDYETALVMYGMRRSGLTTEAVFENTASLIGTHDFHFPLLNYAHRIIPPSCAENYLAAYGPPCELLRDADA